MNNTPLNDYRNLMDNLELPDRVRTSVMRKATQPAYARTSTAPRPVRTPPRRRVRWGLAAGACTAAALCAIIAVGLNALPSHQALNYQPPVSSVDITAPVPAGNFFALAAYAAENPEREPGKTVAVDLGDFGLLGGWSAGTYDRETDTSYEGEGRWLMSCGFSLDLTCTGENVESLTYQIQGDTMHFLIEKRYSTIEEMQDDAALGPIQEYTNEFEIAFADQAADKDAMRRTIITQFPVEGELLTAYDTYLDVAHDPNASPEQVRASSTALDAAVVQHYVALLA